MANGGGGGGGGGGVHVLTVVTDPSAGFHNWLVTAGRHGWRYTVLGHGEAWQGWPWRTRLYLQALQSGLLAPHERVLLVDGTDVLFCGPPTDLVEAYDRLVQGDAHAVVLGAESSCCTGRYVHDGDARHAVYERAVRLVPESRWRYPNGGFVMGRVHALARLLADNQHAADDQEGLLDRYLRGEHGTATHGYRLVLDTQQQCCAQVVAAARGFRPPDMAAAERELDFWYPDRYRRRLVNRRTGATPPVLHFAGHNHAAYNAVVEALFPDAPLQSLDAIDPNRCAVM